MAASSTLSIRPSSGATITSGRPVVSQCAIALAATASSSGVAPVIKRSSEPSSWSVANSRSSASRLASSAPSHRIAGPMRASRLRSGPSANGTIDDHDQEEQRAHQRAAADAHGEPHVADDEGRQRVHAGPSLSSRARSSPIGPCAAATIMPPQARWPSHQLGEARLRGRVERRGRLVEQPDRPLDRDQPRDRQPPPLPGRQIGRRQVGQRREIDRLQRGRDGARRRRRESRPRIAGSRRPTATASARPGGRDNAPARRCVASASPPSSASRPPASRTSPAIMRNSEDLPAPLRPVTSRASPPLRLKLRPAKTSRPPRTQARLSPVSRISRPQASAARLAHGAENPEFLRIC